MPRKENAIRKASLILLALALAAIPAAGRGILEARRTPLRVWVIGPDASAEATWTDFQAALEGLRKSDPRLRVEVKAFPADGYGERLASALAAADGPDAFSFWGGSRLRPLVADGRILALDPYLDDAFRSRLLPGLAEEFLVDGKTCGLPFGAHAAVLFCNRDLFRSYGLETPGAFDGLLEAVRTFRRGGTTAFAMGDRERWPAALFFETLAARRAGSGAAVRERVLAGKFDDPAFLAAAHDVKRLVDAGAFRAEAADRSLFAEGIEAFRDGRAAMMYQGSWLAGSLEGDGSRVKGRVDVAAFPGAATAAAPGAATAAAPGAATAAAGSSLWGGAFLGLCVNARGAHAADAAAFVKEIAPLQDRIACRSGTSLPCFLGSREANGMGTDLGSRMAALMERSADHAPNWDMLLEEKAERAYLEAVAGLFRGAVTPEAFVASLGRRTP